MRRPVDRARLGAFLQAIGRASTSDVACFLVGGASAVQEGWRSATRDIDLRLEPEPDALLRRIAELKDSLETNVEFASPVDFIPVPWAWRDRSRFVARYGRLTVYHFDFLAQALAKLERGHPQDEVDVDAMLERGLVTPDALRDGFDQLSGELHRFPAIAPERFARRVDAAIERFRDGPRPPPADAAPPPPA